MSMSRVAFVAYNSVGQGLRSGWHEGNGRRALVLQNSKGRAVAAFLHSQAGSVRDEIGTLWQTLEQELPQLDHVVVYVGTSGSERAIELASALPEDKVTFVLCDCDLSYKQALIGRSKPNARRLMCECRGIQTMRRLFDRFMETGAI